MSAWSPLRARLASFEHAYAVAVQRRDATGRHQFVIQTGDPTQPYRVTAIPPADTHDLVTRVA
ncbi:hypothetical protein GG804_01875 [Sphingomonas histidinilytica]|uniref:hypothetical protein n=1 Tax=Sphingomonadales TaxID=204457 RepID=UPI00076FEA6A|nr:MULTISPECIES: hypothetical protein [Sphingomonadaceae]AMK23268.1 hypothetical protein K426_11660 [Sphingobium sp. TKS]MBO9375506.1 hypothetical protein [Rhizorhabdus histidinilytica]MCF8709052.1 hypothetical protein [Rhizorhapis sp. SPR117]